MRGFLCGFALGHFIVASYIGNIYPKNVAFGLLVVFIIAFTAHYFDIGYKAGQRDKND